MRRLSGLDPVGRREVRDLILELKPRWPAGPFFLHACVSDAEMLCASRGRKLRPHGRIIVGGAARYRAPGRTGGMKAQGMENPCSNCQGGGGNLRCSTKRHSHRPRTNKGTGLQCRSGTGWGAGCMKARENARMICRSPDQADVDTRKQFHAHWGNRRAPASAVAVRGQ